MSLRIVLRLAFPTLAIAGFLASTVIAQSSPSQDSQSVADAARRSREEKKKAAAKSEKVITDDDIKPAAPSGSAAAAAPVSDTARTPSSAGTPGAGSPGDEKKSQEIAALKEQVKQVQSALDLLKREQALQQDSYYSNADYIRDTAGNA